MHSGKIIVYNIPKIIYLYFIYCTIYAIEFASLELKHQKSDVLELIRTSTMELFR